MADVGASAEFDLDRWRLYSRYGSRIMPAVASAMPVIVDSEAEEMAVNGSHRRISITMGFVSRLYSVSPVCFAVPYCRRCSPLQMLPLKTSLTY